MIISVAKITEDVADRLGESLTLECEPEESPFPGFAARVRALLPGVVRELLMTSPPVLLSGWKALEGRLTVDDDGNGLLALPADFLRLGSLSVTGWNRLVCREEVSPDGVACLRLHRCRPSATLIRGSYLPAPQLTAEGMEISPAIYPLVVEKIAACMREED